MKTSNKDLAALQLNQVINQLTDLADYEIIAIHNDYCEANNDSYNHIIDNGDEAIDSMFDSPSEAMRAARLGDYNHSHNYFILDGYTDLVSFNYTTDDNSPIDVSELAQWLISEDKLSDYEITVTTLDDMLASIEYNISDDSNMLHSLMEYLNIGYDRDKVSLLGADYETSLIDETIDFISDYDYNQLGDIISYLGINYQ